MIPRKSRTNSIKLDLHDVVVTAYLATKPDCQRGRFVAKDDYGYMRHWYESLTACRLMGVILHDSLSVSFVRRFETSSVQFAKVRPSTQFSLNDERFFLFHQWLRQNPCRKVFLTDLSDVFFKGDPFVLVKERKLYVGSETTRTRQNGWMKRKYKRFYGGVLYPNEVVLNAGIVGGWYDDVLRFLSDLVTEIGRLDTRDNCNMVAFNRVIRSSGYDFVTGYPLHSRFKKDGSHATDARIIHKWRGGRVPRLPSKRSSGRKST